MKKNLCFFALFLCLLCTTTAMAQTKSKKNTKEIDNKTSVWQKLVLGGNFGISYSSGWYFDISPTLGYRITPKLQAGGGINFIYREIKYPAGVKDTYTTTGPKAYIRYNAFRNLFAHTEYNSYTYKYKVRDAAGNIVSENKGTVPAFYAGAGYTSNFGRGVGFTVEALWDFLYDETKSLSQEPYTFRFGFNYGL